MQLNNNNPNIVGDDIVSHSKLNVILSVTLTWATKLNHAK